MSERTIGDLATCSSCGHAFHGDKPCGTLVIYARGPGDPPANQQCLCGHPAVTQVVTSSGPCNMCAEKAEAIRDILRPFGLHHYDPVGGVKILAAELASLRDRPVVEHNCDAGVAKATAEERQRCLDLCLAQYAYWRDVDQQEEDRSRAMTNLSMGAMGAASNILAGIMGFKMLKEKELKKGEVE